MIDTAVIDYFAITALNMLQLGAKFGVFAPY